MPVIWGSGEGAPTVPKTPHIFFSSAPRFSVFFFFFRQTAKPGFCGFETAKKHLASDLDGSIFIDPSSYAINLLIA